MNFTTNGTFNAASRLINPDTHETFSIAGKRGSSASFTGTEGDRTLTGDTHATNHNDAMVYDLTLGGSNALRLSGFNNFQLGEGNDALDLTPRQGHADYDFGTAYNPAGLGTSLLVDAGAGNDLVWTGSSADLVVGDLFNPSYEPSLTVGGNDTIDSGAGNDWVLGDVFIAYGFDAGDDQLHGGAGGDFLLGDSYVSYDLQADSSDDSLFGDDTLYGGAGNDRLVGDSVAAVVVNGASTTFGDDDLHGGGGDDHLYGDFAAEHPSSGSGTVYGGADTLVGGGGNDTLYGDFGGVTNITAVGGADVFLFANGDGVDTIMDFGRGADRIDVSAFGFTSFAEVSSLITYNGAHNVATIAFDADDGVTVNQYAQASFTLSDADFIFA